MAANNESRPMKMSLLELTAEFIALKNRVDEMEEKFHDPAWANATCNGCGKGKGPRYHCNTCRNTNLCSKCYEGDFQHVDHTFTVFKGPEGPKMPRIGHPQQQVWQQERTSAGLARSTPFLPDEHGQDLPSFLKDSQFVRTLQ